MDLGVNESEKESEKEQRVRRITQLYYSREDVQKAIFTFSKHREVVPRYFEGFGKRPDSLQYIGDVFQHIKKGATSLHCSEELWRDPLEIATGMNEKKLNEIRIGWDLLLDIDSKYLDYSKILAKHIIRVLKFYGIKNVGIKFSGSKGFHIILPWKAFPKEVNGILTSEMFPVWPRIVTQFIMEATKDDLIKDITETSEEKYDSVKKYIRGEEKTGDFAKKVMPDLVLVSPRHLFRMPYSLHEKTALASAVLLPEEIETFQPRDADPLKVKVRDFMPDSREGEASELLREALDWYKNKNPEEERKNSSNDANQRNQGEFKQIKIENFSEALIPPSIKTILLGLKGDGRKRALFVLINYFRCVGMEKDQLEKKIYEWNSKNEVPLKEGYIKGQLIWSYRSTKSAPPPNYDKDHYSAIGIAISEEEKRYKNPVNYTVRKSQQLNFQNEENMKRTQKEQKRQEKEEKQKIKITKDNFKNKN